MRIFKFFIVLLICVIIGAFAAHNAAYVPLNFYPFDLKISVAAFFLIFISLFLGIILAAIISTAKLISYRRIIKNKDRQIAKLEKVIVEKDTAQLGYANKS